MKTKRIFFFYLLILNLICFNIVFAADGYTLDINCNSDTIKVNDNVTCDIIVNTNGLDTINGFGGKISSSSNIAIQKIDVDSSSWQGNGDDNNLQLYTDKQYSGNVKIATLNLKINSFLSNSNIAINSIVLSTGTDYKSVELSNITKKISINESGTGTVVDDDPGGNDDPGTGTGTDSGNTHSSDVGDNPGTYDSENILYIGIAILLLIVLIIYIYNKKIRNVVND